MIPIPDDISEEEKGQMDAGGIASIKVMGILVAVLGLIGNTLIIVVETRRSSCRTAKAAFKMTLAVADSLNLVTGLIRHVSHSIFLQDPIDISLNMCKVVFFAMYTFQHCSAWILVALNIERYRSIVRPEIQRDYKFSLKVSAFILVVFMASKIWYFSILTTVRVYESSRCGVKDSFVLVHRYFFPWFTMSINCLLPFLVFLVTHILILRHIKQQERERRRQRRLAQKESAEYSTYYRRESPDSNDGQMNLLSVPPVPGQGTAQASGSSSVHMSVPLSVVNSMTSKVEVEEDQWMRAVFHFLLVMDLIFFMLIFPREIFIVLVYMQGWRLEHQRTSSVRIPFGVLSVIAYVQYAIHFLVYVSLGREFRKVLKNVCCGKKEPPPPMEADDQI